jgi:hypothetical protein
MRSRIISAALASFTLALPYIAEAQELQRIVTALTRTINYVLGILIGLAILGFFWGLVRYLFNAKGGLEQRKASMMMVYGVLAIFFMISIFGVVSLLQLSFGINGTAPINPPQYGRTTLPPCASLTQNIGCLAQGVAKSFAIATALLVGVALVLYFSGVAFSMFKYSATGSADKIKNLRNSILWGLLALFIMFSIWGIINLLGNTLFGSSNFNSLL